MVALVPTQTIQLVGWICRAMIDGPASFAGGHNYRQSRAQLQAVNGVVNA
jgi:hypothetical protein